MLNQGYEPVSICSVKKALLLVFLNKADIVEIRPGAVIHTVGATFPYPSVIRLHSYMRLPFRKIELSRKNILRRDNFCCQYCGAHSAPLTLDHVIPKSRGGQDTWENLVTACVPCNNRKGNRTPEEAGKHLRNKPRRPNHIVFLKHLMGKADEPWKPYLFFD